MRERVWFFGFMFLAVFAFGLVGGQDIEDDADPRNPLDLPDSGEDLKNRTAAKWGYLSSQWQEFFLSVSVIKKFDGFMKGISGLFLYLMAQDYSFSLTFFILFLMWIFFGSIFGEFLSGFFDLKGWTRAGVWTGSGVLFSVILSHLGIYKFIISLPGSEYFQGVVWWVGIIMWVVVIVFLLFAYYFAVVFKKWAIRKRKKRIEERAELDRRKIHNIAEGLTDIPD